MPTHINTCACTKIHAYPGQNGTSEAPVWTHASIGMEKYPARSSFNVFNAVFTAAMASQCLQGHPQPRAGIHIYINVYVPRNSTGWRLDRIYESVATWPRGFFSEAEDASFPPCHWDTPRDMGVSGREEYFSNLLKDSCKLWLLAWNFTPSKHPQL